MNWTGGTRQHFAGGKKNSIVQKQRAHFARVREALGDATTSPRSFHPDFLRESGRTAGRNVPVLKESDERDVSLLSKAGRKNFLSHRKDCSDPAERQPYNLTGLAAKCNTDYDRSGRDVRDFNSSGRAGASQGAQGPLKSYAGKTDKHTNVSIATMDLAATRKHLLARSDWLGLSLKRPLQYHFPSHDDKDRIGKRRKIANHVHKDRPIQDRVLSPLFAERLVHPGYMMSGGLPNEEIRVKIGTDAFASQTQPSRKSHTPGRTSLRAPSTDIECLSDPMLLGSDGDIFESGRFAKGATYHVDTYVRDETPRLPSFDERSTWQPAAREASRSPHWETVLNIPDNASDAHRLEPNSWSSALTLEQYDMLPAPEVCSQHAAISAHGIVSGHNSDGSEHAQLGMVAAIIAEAERVPLTGPGSPSGVLDLNDLTDDSSDDDQIWRSLMHVDQNLVDPASVLAMRSSSEHLTTSENSHRPMMHQENSMEDFELLSTPQGAGTQQSSLLVSKELSQHCSPIYRASAPRRVNHIPLQGERMAVTSAVEEQDTSDDALWKTFVGLGSDSDSVSVHDLISAQRSTSNFELTNELLPSPASSMLDVSGLGTSDIATMGASTEDIGALELSLSTEVRSRAPHQADSLLMQKKRNRDSISDFDSDDIEEVPVEPRVDHGYNVRARSRLDVRRFKAPDRANKHASIKAKRFVPTTTDRY